tara:strand:+ start:172 stop:924 length:753 start_codon:yes stop_codon:yes gene_type:complete
MIKILCLGSRVESVRCLRYLVKNVKNIKIIGCVPHFKTQPESVRRDYENIISKFKIPKFRFQEISQVNYDLGLSFLFDKKVQYQEVDKPKLGFINLHLGPLPRFRGANSISYAIKRARKDNIYNFGVTMHYMDYELDTGPIIDLMDVPILENDNAYQLYVRSSDSILPLFKKNIHKIINSKTKISAKKQDPKIKSFFYSKNELNHEIDLNDPPEKIYDEIRALTFPGKPRPFATINGKRVYLYLEDTELN